MNTCDHLREHLLRHGPEAAGSTRQAHLKICASCRGFAGRLARVRRGLRHHHAGVEPDPGFTARLRGRLDQGTGASALGRFALRLLPVSAALLLLLILMATRAAPLQAPMSGEDTQEAYISWLLQADASGEDR